MTTILGHLSTVGLITAIFIMVTIYSSSIQGVSGSGGAEGIQNHGDLTKDEIPTDFHVSTTCGGLLEGSYGEIQYKYGHQYAPNEGCVWTISVGNRSTIKINVLETFSGDYGIGADFLKLGFFNKSNYDQPDFFTWIDLEQKSPQTVEVPGPVAFVQFVSNAGYQDLGFSINFEAGGSEEPSIYNFENYFVGGDTIEEGGDHRIFRYPTTDSGIYGNNQRATIVIKPGVIGSYLNIQNIDVEESLDCLVDSVNIFQFNFATNVWTKVGGYCGVSSGYYTSFQFSPVATRTDPLIVTFKSDDSTTGTGFQLFWNNPNQND